jgi:hypothetical protein
VADALTFTITVVDPCKTATIIAPTLSAQSVVNGATSTFTFAEATDSVDAAQPVKSYCGDRNYVVVSDNTGTDTSVSWISVAKDTPSADTHTVTLSPADTSLVQSFTFYLKTTYAEYASHSGIYTALVVTVTSSGCNCDLLTWDNPVAQTVTVNVGVASPVT